MASAGIDETWPHRDMIESRRKLKLIRHTSTRVSHRTLAARRPSSEHHRHRCDRGRGHHGPAPGRHGHRGRRRQWAPRQWAPLSGLPQPVWPRMHVLYTCRHFCTCVCSTLPTLNGRCSRVLESRDTRWLSMYMYKQLCALMLRWQPWNYRPELPPCPCARSFCNTATCGTSLWRLLRYRLLRNMTSIDIRSNWRTAALTNTLLRQIDPTFDCTTPNANRQAPCIHLYTYYIKH